MSTSPPDDSAARARYHLDGAVFLPGVLSEIEVDVVRDVIDRTRATPSVHYGLLSPEGRPRVDSDLFRWNDDDEYRSVLLDGPIASAAAMLLGVDDVVFVEDQWFASSPDATTSSPWHQDAPYYNIDEPFLTIWVALDDVPAASALRTVRRRADDVTVYAPVEFSTTLATTAGSTTLPPAPNPDLEPRFEVLSWDVRAGDAIALHSLTLHAAGGAPVMGRWFRRLSTRWARPSARYVDRGTQAASFWRVLDHGLRDGDRLACAQFPLVSPGRSYTASP